MASVDESGAKDRRIDAEEVAEQVLAEMTDSDHLRGVGYYTPEECDTIYLREDVKHETNEPKRPLEDAILESISLQTLEDIFADDLTGTVRFFDGKVVFYSCAAEYRGIVVTFDRDSDLNFEDILMTLEEITGKANSQR